MGYKITYNTKGGILQTGLTNPTLNQDTLPSPLPWCIKENSTFLRWIDAGTQKTVVAGQSLTKDITLEAIYSSKVPQVSHPTILPIEPFAEMSYSTISLTLYGNVEIYNRVIAKVTDTTTTTAENVELGNNIYLLRNIDTIDNYVTSAKFILPHFFENNHKYNIQVALISEDYRIMSAYSQTAFFECYTDPTLEVYLDANYTQLLNTSKTTTFTSPKITLYPKFNSNDVNSPAILTQLKFSLRNQDTGDIIEDTDWLASTITSITFYNIPSVNYRVLWNFETNGGGKYSGNADIAVDYTLSSLQSSSITATNYAKEGYIKITTDIDFSALEDKLGFAADSFLLTRKIVSSSPITSAEEIKLMQIPTPKDPVTSDQFNFSVIDPFNQANVMYEYALYPCYNGEVAKVLPFTTQVYSYFRNAFICDAYTSFQMINGLSYITNTKNNTGLYDPYGATYPVVVSNSTIKYDTGEINFTSLSRSTTLARSSKVSEYDEVRNRIELNNFLTNKQPKILKDTMGNIWVVYITNDITNSYNNAMYNIISNTSYSWAEISDLSEKGLNKIGMLGRFAVVYTNGSSNSYYQICTIGKQNNIHM